MQRPLAPFPSRTLAVGLALAALAPTAAAQVVDLTFDPLPGSGALSTTLGVDLSGSLIGDFDAATNPGGTRTLPGLFGGSGNEPVPVSLGLSGTSLLLAAPTGGFRIAVVGDTAEVTGLELDLTGGTPGSADLVLSLLYDTFRTFQPDSLYVGGFPLDLPLGATPVGPVQLVQSGPAIGTAGPLGAPLGSQVDVLVPVELTLELDLLGDGTPLGPLPLLLPLSGVLVPDGDGWAFTSAVAFDLDQTLDDPAPGFELADLPFALPTILPPGGTANLLFTLGIDALSVGAAVDLTLQASGDAVCGAEALCAGEPNSSGQAAGLRAQGSASLMAGELAFEVTGLPLAQFGYLLMSPTTDGVPDLGGGDGILCLGAPVTGFVDDVQWSRGVGSVTCSPVWGALPGGTAVLPGETWHFQYWYRDFAAGRSTNLSAALSVTFCP